MKCVRKLSKYYRKCDLVEIKIEEQRPRETGNPMVLQGWRTEFQLIMHAFFRVSLLPNRCPDLGVLHIYNIYPYLSYKKIGGQTINLMQPNFLMETLNFYKLNYSKRKVSKDLYCLKLGYFLIYHNGQGFSFKSKVFTHCHCLDKNHKAFRPPI